jgi:hypothetical protein
VLKAGFIASVLSSEKGSNIISLVANLCKRAGIALSCYVLKAEFIACVLSSEKGSNSKTLLPIGCKRAGIVLYHGCKIVVRGLVLFYNMVAKLL